MHPLNRIVPLVWREPHESLAQICLCCRAATGAIENPEGRGSNAHYWECAKLQMADLVWSNFVKLSLGT